MLYKGDRRVNFLGKFGVKYQQFADSKGKIWVVCICFFLLWPPARRHVNDITLCAVKFQNNGLAGFSYQEHLSDRQMVC